MMFKKFAALMLVLCLVCGTVALAEDLDTQITTNGGTGSTTVSYTVALVDDYMVRIPTGASFAEGIATTKLPVAIIPNEKFNSYGATIAIKLSGSANAEGGVFYLKRKGGNEKIAYKIFPRVVEECTDSEVVILGDVLLSWAFDAAKSNPNERATADLGLAADIENAIVAGEYTDVLTFTVETNIPDPDVIVEEATD